MRISPERQFSMPPASERGPKTPEYSARSALALVAQRVNEYAAQTSGLHNLLDNECKLSMEHFGESSGGTYSDTKVEQDMQETKEIEVELSGANDPDISAHYKETYRVQNADQHVAKWKANKDRSKSGQMEIAATILLHKALGQRYVVARASEYDDYTAGADHIILDTHTGEVLCAVDDVHEGGREDKRIKQKKEKVEKIMRKGGCTIEYGITMKEGRMARSRLEGLPVFYLGLHQSDLEDLLRNMDYQNLDATSPTEQAVYAKFISSLTEQTEEFAALPLPRAVKTKLAAFQATLAELGTQHEAST